MCGPYVNCASVLLQLLVFGLSNGAALALNAIGVTVIYSTVRTLNLAHGDVFALSAALVVSLINAIGIQQNWPPLLLIGSLALSLGAAVLFGMLLSVGVEQLAFRPFRGKSKLAPLIATLGLSFILFQIALIWRTFSASWIPGEHRSAPGVAPEVPIDRIPDLLPGFDLVHALGLPPGAVVRFADVFVVLLAIGFAFAVRAYLQRSATGKSIRAVAQNATMAEMLGISPAATITRAFALGGGLAGVAAFIFVLVYARPFGAHGAESGLLAFAAALIGGIGNPLGALVAALMMGALSSYSDYFLSAQWTPVLTLGLLIAILVIRPGGLAGDYDDSQPATLRDSVILTAPGQGARSNRWLILAFAALAVLPLLALMFNLGGITLLKGMMVFVLLALGLNLLLGLAGVLDLGYAMSFGIGAYVAAILTNATGPIGSQLPQPLEFLPVVLLAAIAAGAFGALKGALAARLRGDYLAVATLAFGLLAQRVVINLPDLTGGKGGITLLPAPTIATLRLADPTLQYFLGFMLALGAAILTLRLMRSRTGRAWLAASEDEGVAMASGVDVAHYRMLAFVLSSTLAGVAGALYASLLAYIDPETLSFHISALTLTMVILGGAGSVSGVALGAALIFGYDKAFVPGLASLVAKIWPSGFWIGPSPDIRGASYFNFGLALYLTVLLRAWRREKPSLEVAPSRPALLPPKEGQGAAAVDGKALWARLGSVSTPFVSPRRVWLTRLAWFLPALLIIGLIVLATPRKPAPTVIAQVATAAPSPYDGAWEGSGTMPDGTPVALVFTVRGGSLASIRYEFPGKNAERCSTFDFAPASSGKRPVISDSALAVNIGDNIALDMKFLSERAVKGEMTIHWRHRFENCAGDYQAEWTAARP